MANTKSALKYIRKSATRTLRNRQQKSRLKTLLRNWMQPLRKQMELRFNQLLVPLFRHSIRLVSRALCMLTRLHATRHVVQRYKSAKLNLLIRESVR